MAGAERPGSFGLLLRQHRLGADLTQAGLAERAGLSVRAVQHLERGLGQPQRETTRRLAEALALTGAERASFELAAAPAPRRRTIASQTEPEPAVDRASPPGAPPDPALDLTGERKRLTVLAADLVGLTESDQRFEPDLADQILARAVELLAEVVHQYGGTVNMVRGDGLMALFGAPLAQEDDAVRACYAALAMQQALRRLTQQLAEQHDLRLALRVGLDSGEVVVRTAANDLSWTYTALGPAVRTASRLQQQAANAESLLSEATLRLTEGHFTVQSVAPAADGGSASLAGPFRLTGLQPARSRFQRVASSRQLTHFVGRQAELAVLDRPLERARAGHGGIAAVVGEPGVGKSRLIWELVHSPRTEGWLVLECGAVSYGTASPYLPIVNLLKSYARIAAQDDLATVAARLAARVLSLDPGLEPELAPLLSLLDVPIDPSTDSGQAAWLALDPPLRRRRTLEALKHLLLRESQRQPLLLVMEDLHWIDAETQALLDSLVDSLPTAALLVLVSYRPEYEHRWGGRSAYTQLQVAALPAESAAALLGALLGDDPDLGALQRLLIERTEGNPLFLEESVRALVETGALAGRPGGYRLARPIEALQVPATLQTVLAARIDRLGPELKRRLQAASVIGKDVPLALLRAIDPGDEAALQHDLARLQAAELLYEARYFPEPEYSFKHALTHDVAYGSLLLERRRATHAQVMAAIERLSAERQDEKVDQLAYHALRGEVWDKALAYVRQAGQKAVGRSALPQAAEYFEQALAALAHLPDSRPAREQAVDLRLELRSALYPQGEFGRIVERLREAETIAASLDDQGRLARLSAYLASSLNTIGRHALAVEPARRALAIGTDQADLGACVLGDHFLGLAYHALGEYAHAATHLRRNLERLRGDLLGERFGMHGAMSVFSRSPLVWSLAELGDFSQANRLNRESFQIAEAVQHAPTRGGAFMGASLLYVRAGEFDRAVELGEEAVPFCRHWGLWGVLPYVLAQLGYAQVLSGRPAEGEPHLARGLALAAEIGHLRSHALWLAWLGEARLLAGRSDEALADGQRALTLARQRGERGTEAWALRLQAEIAANQAPSPARPAREQYDRALSLAQALGMRPLAAHCLAGRGRLEARLGRPEAARSDLTAAREAYGSLGQEGWRASTQSALDALE
jgi:predicted ATPase/class 3 adenylate cyclase